MTDPLPDDELPEDELPEDELAEDELAEEELPEEELPEDQLLEELIGASHKHHQAVGVDYSASPHGKHHKPHNGVALNSLNDNPLLVKHVANVPDKQHPHLCAETLAFYSGSVPPKAEWPKGVNRAKHRWHSHYYGGTPIVYLWMKDGTRTVNNAVFKKFVKEDGTVLNLHQTLLLSKSHKDELKKGTLCIGHYNIVKVKDEKGNKSKVVFKFQGEVLRTEVYEIHLM